jgi:hypothetical protein
MAHETALRSHDHGHRSEGSDGDGPPLAGLWQVMLGAALAVLAPLFGFLGGTAGGTEGPDDKVDTLLAWMIGGLFLGGLGTLVAILGGLRLYQQSRRDDVSTTTPSAART